MRGFGAIVVGSVVNVTELFAYSVRILRLRSADSLRFETSNAEAFFMKTSKWDVSDCLVSFFPSWLFESLRFYLSIALWLVLLLLLENGNCELNEMLFMTIYRWWVCRVLALVCCENPMEVLALLLLFDGFENYSNEVCGCDSKMKTGVPPACFDVLLLLFKLLLLFILLLPEELWRF